MLRHHNQDKKQNYPVRKAHHVGTSVVLTIDPIHVKRLRIDDFTFFIQKPSEHGIVLEMCRLDIDQTGSEEEQKNEVQ